MRVEIPCNGHWLSPQIGGYLDAGHWLSRRILVFIPPQIGGYLAAGHWLSCRRSVVIRLQGTFFSKLFPWSYKTQ
jgi:hypothetical protein